ncbi:MAG: SDR family NAD(P)-dependent oxidoreductase [bacterium]
MLLKNKVILISGASRGLGKALALGFAKQGAKLAICSRNANAIAAVRDEIKDVGGHCTAEQVNIVHLIEVENFIKNILAKFQKIDVLINNASILGKRVEIVDYPAEVWQQVIDVNLNGAFNLCKAVIPDMIQNRSGSIINVTSGVSISGRAEWGAYSVSKFGVEGLTQILAAELKKHNIRANSVDPQAMATEMRRQAYPGEDQSKLRKPGEILDVFFYLASDKSIGVTGQRFRAQEFRL